MNQPDDFVPASEEEKQKVADISKSIEENTNINRVYPFTKVLRFLRGRKGDKDRAYRALVKHDEWRTEFHVDSIASSREFSQNCRNIIQYGPSMKLKSGEPAIFIISKSHNKNNRNLEELRDYIVGVFEEALKNANPHEERMSIVFDLHGFSLSETMDYEAVQLIIEILSFNYPDTLHRAFIVNHPFFFSACWFVISPWMDPVTRAKVCFCSPADLTAYILPENIPQDVFGVPRDDPGTHGDQLKTTEKAETLVTNADSGTDTSN